MTYEKTNELSPFPCWRKIGGAMSQVAGIFSIAVTLSLGSATAQTTSSFVITSPPVGAQKQWSSAYPAAKYLKIEKYNIHISGTATVTVRCASRMD